MSTTGIYFASRDALRIRVPSTRIGRFHRPFKPAYRSQTRTASNYASSTAINAVIDIPNEYQGLYESLQRLKKDAANYIDLSRLQLALRSLESRTPTVRIAILSLQGVKEGRSLARLLCADALEARGDWESKLDSSVENETRSLLLRYGDETETSTSNSMIYTLNIRSRILQRHNLEILVSALPNQYAAATALRDPIELQDSALVPMLETPRSFRGDVSLVRHPVHCTIVLGRGVRGCLGLSQWVSEMSQGPENVKANLSLALDLPQPSQHQESLESPPGLNILNISLAAKALDSFRRSNENAAQYEQGWSNSGVSRITDWIECSAQACVPGMKRAVKDLVLDLLERTSRNMTKEEAARLQAISSNLLGQRGLFPLQKSLEEWAMKSHTELQDRLDAMLADASWSKLRWWKLAWRADDVGLILTGLLERSWLVDAEKGVIWLAGRSSEPAISVRTQTREDEPTMQQETSNGTTAQTEPGVGEETARWQAMIPRERARIRASLIPSLESQAQTLVSQVVSVSGLTLTLSTLVYVSFPALSIYEAGALAALGLGWSLRRLQKGWEEARSQWALNLRERGRHALKSTEEQLTAAILRSPESNSDASEVTDRKRARDAIEMARQSLALAGRRGGGEEKLNNDWPA